MRSADLATIRPPGPCSNEGNTVGCRCRDCGTGDCNADRLCRAAIDRAEVHLANITLPAGTLNLQHPASRRIERWLVMSGSYDSNLQYFRKQLPIGRAFDGLQWCSEDGQSDLGFRGFASLTDC